MSPDPRTTTAARLYRAALRLLPSWLPRELGEDMAELFARRERETAARSRLRLPALWARELLSVLRLALVARWRGRDLLALGASDSAGRRSASTRTPLSPSGELAFMDTLGLDLRYAFRTLAKSPGFTIVALLTIGIGIGVNTALFGVVNAVLLRSLPFEEPERLVEIMTTDDDPPGPDSHSAMSLPDVRDYDAAAETLTGVAAHSIFITGLADGNASRMIMGEIVTGNYFEVLGAPILAGRPLAPDDDRVAGGHPVAVISHDFWRAHFNGDPDAIGQTVTLAGIPYEVVGIAGPTFTGAFAGVSTRLWIPTMMAEQVEPAGTNDVTASPGDNRMERRGHRWLSVKARLADGVGMAQARAELEAIGAAIAQRYPDINGERRPVLLEPGSLRIHPSIDSAFASVVGFLFGIVGLVLVVACANVANMLLARASGRGREVAIRAALGAGRRRLIRQMVTESVLLGLGGGLLGLALGAWVAALLTAVPLPIPFELPLDFGFDYRVFGFALGVALLTGLVFGVAPALRATRADLVPALRGTGRGSTGPGQSWLQSGLLVAQVTVSLTLLVGAALFLMTARAAGQVDLGLDADRIVVLDAPLEMAGYEDAEAIDFYPRARERLAALPGVDSVSFATGLPLNFNLHSGTVFPEGVEPREGGRGYIIPRTIVGPAYFDTVGATVIRGRAFDARDNRDGRPVTIVNEAFVRRFWPGESPIGKLVRANGRDWEVVGVLRDHKVTSPVDPATPYIHFPWRQRPSPFVSLLVRTSGPAEGRVAEMQRAMLDMEPNIVFMMADTFASMAGSLTLPLRVAAMLLVVFAGVAGLLAAIGLYGVVAQAVARRTREVGIRKALGAGSGSVIRLVVRQSTGVALTGVVAGLVLAYLAASAFSGFLYGVTPTSPLPYAAGLLVLLLILAIAHLVPARRASRVDPMVALRQD